MPDAPAPTITMSAYCTARESLDNEQRTVSKHRNNDGERSNN